MAQNIRIAATGRARRGLVLLLPVLSMLLWAGAGVGSASAVLGQTCTGTVGSTFAFTINSAGVPAGSTWSVTASRSASPYELRVTSDSPYVQSSGVGPTHVALTAPNGVPAGTVVTLTPRYFLVPTSGSANVLTLSGHGGSTSASFSSTSDPC